MGLLLRDDTTWLEMKEGLCTIVERGILNVKDSVTLELEERIVSQPEGIGWLRSFLSEETDAFYMRRARLLLRSAFVAVLTDEELSEHVKSWLACDEIETRSIRETTSAESHANLLQPHFAAFPRAAAQHAISVAIKALRNGYALHPERDLLELPIGYWLKTGSTNKNDTTVQDLVRCIVDVWSQDRLVNDWLYRRSVLGLLYSLVDAEVLQATDKISFIKLIDESLEVSRKGDDSAMHVLDIAATRFAFGNWVPSEKLRDLTMSLYEKIKNSTAADQWMDLIEFVGLFFTSEQKGEIANYVIDYADCAIRKTNKTWTMDAIYSELTAAKGIHNAIKCGIVDPKNGGQKLLELIQKKPNCAAWALNLPEIDETVAAAEEIVVSATARCEDNGYSLVGWCDWLPEGTVASRWLEEVLIARLFAPVSLFRQRAYWSLMHLGNKKALSETALGLFKDAILRFGRIDKATRPRAAAVSAANCIRFAFSDDEIRRIQDDAQTDPVAWVRRAGDILALNPSHSQKSE